MSHFYGVLSGSRGEATRCGTKNSGMSATAASWKGAINVVLYEENGVDMYRVVQIPWRGNGVSKVLAKGVVGE